MPPSFREPLEFAMARWVVVGFAISGFLVVIGSIIIRALMNLSQPELVRDARVVAKRQHTSGSHHHHHHHHHHHPSTSTRYYVTFEFPDGRREEFQVAGSDFGMLAEGDEGALRSQGTWFKGFVRRT
jgi:hypothetical protein